MIKCQKYKKSFLLAEKDFFTWDTHIIKLNKSDIKVQSMFCTYSMDCIFRINEN